MHPADRDPWAKKTDPDWGPYSEGPNPILLFCRRLIEDAFHAACQCVHGEPTEDALESFAWLLARSDWTLYGRMERAGGPPSAQAREEYSGTFEWACRWLGEDPAKVRRSGITPLVSVAGARNLEHKHVAGIPAIYEAWRQAQMKHELAAVIGQRDGTQTSPGKDQSMPGKDSRSFMGEIRRKNRQNGIPESLWGALWSRRKGRWLACIPVNGGSARKYLAECKTAEEAHITALEAWQKKMNDSGSTSPKDPIPHLDGHGEICHCGRGRVCSPRDASSVATKEPSSMNAVGMLALAAENYSRTDEVALSSHP